MTTIANIEDRSFSQLIAGMLAIRVKLSEAKSRRAGISDLDISALCFNSTIMQNKPNLLDTTMGVSAVIPRTYRDSRLCARLKDKPNFQI